MVSIRSTSAQRSAGRSGRTVASGGAPSRIRFTVSTGEAEVNGWRPASASQRSTPVAHTSAAPVASFPSSRSGETYASVPGTSPAAVSVSASSSVASPKSSTRTSGSGPSASITFAGFTSRWTTFFACAWARPSRICAADSTAAASSSDPPTSASRSVRPCTYS